MSSETQNIHAGAPAEVQPPRRRRTIFAAGALALLAMGGVAGAGITAATSAHETALLIEPTAVNAIKDDTDVAIRGKVAEIFGNKFVLADASGRTLVETGRRGESGGLVKLGEEVTVQGRFDRGFVKGQLLVRADGSAESLKPPRPGPAGWADRLNGFDVSVVQPAPRP